MAQVATLTEVLDVKLLFLDDSFRQKEEYLGYGGFCVDQSDLPKLVSDLASLKADFNIPQDIEIKWSPDPKHFLRTHFRKSRQELYRSCVDLLRQRNALILCSAVDLRQCYGRSLHGWDLRRSRQWAAGKLLSYISERFERPCLTTACDLGIIIADQYGDTQGEPTLMEEISSCLRSGTKFQKFQGISVPPLFASSKHCAPLQLADVVVGLVVSALAKSKWGLELFKDIALLFLRDPHEKAISFASTVSASTLGIGLVLFPDSFRVAGYELFDELDKQYVLTDAGLKQRQDSRR